MRAGCWVVCYRKVGIRVAPGGGRGLERTAKCAQERQQLGDGGQRALSEEGELQMLCGGFLAQFIQSLKESESRELKYPKTVKFC